MTLYHSFKTLVGKFKRDESGATAIEYGLFAALIGAVIVTTVGLLGGNINSAFVSVNDAISSAISADETPVVE